MKVVISNAVSLNGGDAAILLAVVQGLRRLFGERLDLTVLDSNAAVAGRFYPDLRFLPVYLPPSPSRWLRCLRRLCGAFPSGPLWPGRLSPRARLNFDQFCAADLIVSTGGTYLVEHYDLSPRLSNLELAVRSGTPTVLFTQSLGPFRRLANRRRLRELLPHTKLILLRDEESRRNLEDLGLSLPQARVVADAVFALADPEALVRSKARTLPPRPRVAISVREWRHFRSGATGDRMRVYAGALQRTVERLVRDHDAVVVFISTCQGIPEYHADDAHLAQAIAERLPQDVRRSVAVDAAFHDPRALLEDMKGFDLVVATRMHMAILSLAAGTPVLPIAYEFKTAELFRRLGLAEWIQDIETVDPQTLPGTVAAFLDHLPDIRPGLLDAVIDEHRLAWSAVEELSSLIASRAWR